jgi:hypothetical protein
MYLKACKILDVKIGSGQDEIKKAFRKLAVEYHPDVSDKPRTIIRFIEINRAYKYLSDPDAYLRFINRHHAIREMKKRQHTYESTYEESMAYKKQKEEQLPDMPPLVAAFAHFLEKFYDYIFLMVGLFMIIAPPLIFITDDKIKIEDTGILPIVVPLIIGIAFFSGVFIYMLRHHHPFALKVQMLFYRFIGKK